MSVFGHSYTKRVHRNCQELDDLDKDSKMSSSVSSLRDGKAPMTWYSMRIEISLQYGLPWSHWKQLAMRNWLNAFFCRAYAFLPRSASQASFRSSCDTNHIGCKRAWDLFGQLVGNVFVDVFIILKPCWNNDFVSDTRLKARTRNMRLSLSELLCTASPRKPRSYCRDVLQLRLETRQWVIEHWKSRIHNHRLACCHSLFASPSRWGYPRTQRGSGKITALFSKNAVP